MSFSEENSDWQPIPPGFLGKVLPCHRSPYEWSVFGEHARLLLLLVATPLLAWFAYTSISYHSGILALVATAVLLLSLITSSGYPILRIAVLAAIIGNVFSSVVNTFNVIGSTPQAPTDIPDRILLFCLVIASVFEFSNWVNASNRTTLIKASAWGVLAIPAIFYIVGIPAATLLWETIEADERKLALRDADWTILNEAVFRTAKLAIFAVFTYCGACLGSFLNVVAHCVPRGKAIGLRHSQCPQCDTKIARADNLPIFSYINLAARCRNCSASIPARYLIVELVVAAIFGSLFLHQLVTGCANVPLMNFDHTGILWIILYPKWPAIAIYFYHAFFMSTVTLLSLIEWDEQTLKLPFAVIIGLGFIVAASIYPPIQPIPLTAHLSGISFDFTPFIEQLLKLTIGGLAGAAIGRVLGAFLSPGNTSILTLAFLLTGVVLGWQALAQVTIIFLALTAVTRLLPKANTLIKSRPTAVVLGAIMIHHPFWNTIAGWSRYLFSDIH